MVFVYVGHRDGPLVTKLELSAFTHLHLSIASPPFAYVSVHPYLGSHSRYTHTTLCLYLPSSFLSLAILQKSSLVLHFSNFVFQIRFPFVISLGSVSLRLLHHGVARNPLYIPLHSSSLIPACNPLSAPLHRSSSTQFPHRNFHRTLPPFPLMSRRHLIPISTLVMFLRRQDNIPSCNINMTVKP